MAEFIEEHYGQEAVDYLAEPLLSGVYGGDPRRAERDQRAAALRRTGQPYGSLTRGVLAERAKARSNGPAGAAVPHPQGRPGPMVDAVAEAIRGQAQVRQGRAETVERTATGFRIKMDGDWLEADRLVMACEAHSASPLAAGR